MLTALCTSACDHQPPESSSIVEQSSSAEQASSTNEADSSSAAGESQEQPESDGSGNEGTQSTALSQSEGSESDTGTDNVLKWNAVPEELNIEQNSLGNTVQGISQMMCTDRWVAYTVDFKGDDSTKCLMICSTENGEVMQIDAAEEIVILSLANKKIVWVSSAGSENAWVLKSYEMKEEELRAVMIDCGDGDKTVTDWYFYSGKLYYVLQGSSKEWEIMSCLADGSNREQKVRLYRSSEDQEPIQTAAGSRYLYWQGEPGTNVIHVLDMVNGTVQRVSAVIPSGYSVQDIQICGETIVFPKDKRKIAVYDLEEGRELQTVSLQQDFVSGRLCQGRYFLSSDGNTVRIYDLLMETDSFLPVRPDTHGVGLFSAGDDFVVCGWEENQFLSAFSAQSYNLVQCTLPQTEIDWSTVTGGGECVCFADTAGVIYAVSLTG